MPTYIAGHNGMVGSAVRRRLEGQTELLLRSRKELDLCNQASVNDFFAASDLTR